MSKHKIGWYSFFRRQILIMLDKEKSSFEDIVDMLRKRNKLSMKFHPHAYNDVSIRDIVDTLVRIKQVKIHDGLYEIDKLTQKEQARLDRDRE